MRKFLLFLNSFVFVSFACFLAYTYVAKEHLESLARGFLVERTVYYSKPLMGVVELAVNDRRAAFVVPAPILNIAIQEVADYQSSPQIYVGQLVDGRELDTSALKDAENPLLLKVAEVKNSIVQFYNKSWEALIRDLRIFAISNIVAALIAFGVAYRAQGEIRMSLILLSHSICLAVLYSSFMYIDDMTFFQILFRLHMGWSYPIGLATMTLQILRDLSTEVEPCEKEKP